jgi:hypothetical protein
VVNLRKTALGNQAQEELWDLSGYVIRGPHLDHYEPCFRLGLAAQEKEDILEYLKSLPESK